MKKTKLLLALCLVGSVANAQVTNLVTNGGFESYNTLPTTCPASTNLSDVNGGWAEYAQKYHYTDECDPGFSGGTVPCKILYYNDTTGGNGSCEPTSANSGFGYIACTFHGYDPLSNSNGSSEQVYQVLSSLSSSKKYLFTEYAWNGTGYGSSVLAVPSLINGSGSGTASTLTVTGSSGWVKVQTIFTIPTSGSYSLFIGANNFCFPSNALENFAIDDVSLQELCVANAGSNVVDQDTVCCGCATPGVQIGTSSIAGLSYVWAPSANIKGSNTVAQPIANWCNTESTKIYTVTVSGTGCVTNTSTVQVGTHTFDGSSCCRLAEGIATENQTATAFGVYPNPATGQVTVSLYDKAEYIRIIDMQGRLVFETKNIDAQEFKVDIAKYTKGVYFITAKIGDTIEKQKLIVE